MTLIHGIVLAAGFSRRMGRPKALLPLHERTFLESILNVYRSQEVPCWVVLGEDAENTAAVARVPREWVLVNPRPEDGPLASLRIALRRVPPEAAAVFVHPVDHPLVRSQTLERMREEFLRTGAPIVVPVFRARRGHPVLFGRSVFPELFEAPLEEGARWVVRLHRDEVREVEVDDPGVHGNINTPDDYAAWIGGGSAE